MLAPEPMNLQSSVRWAVALTLFLVIAPHWLLTRDLADGAVISFTRAIGNAEGLFLWLSNSNWFLAIAYYKIVFVLSDLTGFSYLVFVKCFLSMLLVGLYLECSLFARDVLKLPANHAALAALLCVASPCLYTLANTSATISLLCLWLVLTGHRLYWSDKVLVRIIGLALLVVSFQVNSNLVFALALDTVRLWQFKNLRKQRLVWFLTLFMVAVLFFITMRAISPPKQSFVEYNQLLNPLNAGELHRMVRATAMFLTWGVIPLMALAAVFFASFIFRSRQKNYLLPEAVQSRQSLSLVLALGFLATAASFPYIAVGKGAPLFTLTAYGNGLTEQVLRAAYQGPLAPTWANTAARHGFLISVPVGLLTWIAAVGLAQKMRMRLSPLGLYSLLLPFALFWVLPAYGNKLQNQWAELSLVKGFRELPAAEAGIVELKYQPISSWLIWSTSANMILREAWGKSEHLGFFYSVNAYKDDLYWQYQAYILNTGVLQSRTGQHTSAMDGFPGADCYTKYQGLWPTPTTSQLIFGGWFSEMVTAATIQHVESECEVGRVLPNPYPNKKVIY